MLTLAMRLALQRRGKSRAVQILLQERAARRGWLEYIYRETVCHYWRLEFIVHDEFVLRAIPPALPAPEKQLNEKLLP